MTEGPAAVVLFDFGGVVIRTPFELHDYPWRGPFDVSTDPLWARSMAGEITEREYWHERAAAYFPQDEDPTHTFMRTLYEQDESVIVRPEIGALLDELQGAGVRTAVLTNDLAAFHPPEWIERMTVIRRFDPLIDLSHVGYLKPQPEAFEHALKSLGVSREDAASIVFLDDQPRNVAGAEACGLRGVHFNPVEVEASLDTLRKAAGLPS